MNLNIILTSLDSSLAQAWDRFCGDLDFVTVYQGSILDVKCDAVVSPANSFGFMDGGIDGVYARHFGKSVQHSVQEAINNYHHGELLVGAADVVETGDSKIPYLIAAPTMRVPMKLDETVAPYLAARAVFLLIQHGSFKTTSEPIAGKINRVAFPGLGTGVGGVGPNTCARQVRAAIDDVLRERFTPPRTWAEASERHQLLYTDRVRRMQ